MNIFINIKDTNFFQANRLADIDELSKILLRQSIQLQFNEFKMFLLPKFQNLDLDIMHDYQHIKYIEENDNINPLEHCLINNFIYPQNGTSFMNYYNKGIIKYLINIGFTSDIELIKKIIDNYLGPIKNMSVDIR